MANGAQPSATLPLSKNGDNCATGTNGALRILYTSNAPNTNGSELRWTFSDASFSTQRPVGYISFKIQQNSNASVAAANYVNFRLGPADSSSLGIGGNTWLELRFKAATTANLVVSSAAGPNQASVTISNTNLVPIQVWYNQSANLVSYIRPDTSASTNLMPGTFAVYASGTPVVTGTFAASVETPAVTTAIGKMAFLVASTQKADFTIDDVYAADTVPAAVVSPPVITSPSTANAFLGKTFTYQITGSNSPTSFNAVGLPAGLTNNPTTGLITGTPTGSLGTSAVILTASNALGTSQDFTLSITVNPAPVVTWNNTGSAWAINSCWTNGAAPVNDWSTDTAVFTGDYGNSNNEVTLVSGRQVSTILFNTGANAYTFAGGDITVGNGITNNSLNVQTFNSKVYGNSNRSS